MSKNIVFVFSGTGNSLWAAKEIAKELHDCEITTMGIHGMKSLIHGYEAIGFVYPTYGRGIPGRVREFIKQLDLQDNQNAYFFAVATCGGIARAKNAIPQVRHALACKKITLHYGACLAVVSNYILSYEVGDTEEVKIKQAAIDLQLIIRNIQNHLVDTSNMKTNFVQQISYLVFMRLGAKADEHYIVSDACIECGICKKVCPVDNIGMNDEGKPAFLHHCEQCFACIQYCPANAINYKDQTQGRTRYHYPAISWKELEKLNERAKQE